MGPRADSNAPAAGGVRLFGYSDSLDPARPISYAALVLRRAALAIGIAALLVVPSGCGSRAGKVIVLGLDGIDPRAVDMLVAEGRLPAFARLRAEGAFGLLHADPPLVSPVLWTTMATGRRPADHGITSFKESAAGPDAKQPVTSTMRRVPALWNIASEAGRRVAVVGWWATWPPETVNGAVVSDRSCYHLLFEEGQQGQAAIRDAVNPPELAGRVAPMIRRPSDIGEAESARFISVPADELARPFDFADDLSHFRWALASATSYAAIGEDLWRTEHPDLLMVYIEATDSTSHLFGHLFRAEGLAGELAEQQARYGHAVEEMYVWADELLGRLMAAAGDDTTLVVLSDHGFKLGELHGDPSVTRDMRRVSTKAHETYGIVGLWGRGVRPGAAIQAATQLDITPTVLTLLGLPAAQDMPGRVLATALAGVKAAPRRASYERAEATSRSADRSASGAADEQVIAHLEALGYLGDDEEASLQRQADVDVLLAAGRFEEAAAAYRGLIERTPDDPALHLNLGYALEHLDRLDESLASLNRALELDPDLALAHYNRGVVLERLGDRDGAIAAFRAAAQSDDTLTSARTALQRLTGSPLVYAPTTEQQARAAALAAEASGEARRGDYPRALDLLAEAERLWPDCPLVFQYRANVTYLMGDLEAAISALERAAALEPGNVAVRTNLERLRRRLAAAGG